MPFTCLTRRKELENRDHLVRWLFLRWHSRRAGATDQCSRAIRQRGVLDDIKQTSSAILTTAAIGARASSLLVHITKNGEAMVRWVAGTSRWVNLVRSRSRQLANGAVRQLGYAAGLVLTLIMPRSVSPPVAT